MCGIAGFQLSPSDHELRGRTALLARFLLIGIDHRGGDATGASWVDETREIHDAITVGPYRSWKRAYGNIVRNADMAILHTRFATQGSKKNPRNNHPIASGPVRLVHNGCIWNDNSVFRVYPIARRGEVDSEAIAAAIRGEQKIGGTVVEALEYVSGSMAIAWIDENRPDTLNLARGDHSPLVVALTPGGSLLFASVESALKSAVTQLLGKSAWSETYVYNVPEGKVYAFQHGLMTDKADFVPDAGWGMYAGKRWDDYKSDLDAGTDAAWKSYLADRYDYSPAVTNDADIPCVVCEDYGEPLDNSGWCPACRYLDEHGEMPVIMGPVTRKQIESADDTE